MEKQLNRRDFLAIGTAGAVAPLLPPAVVRALPADAKEDVSVDPVNVRAAPISVDDIAGAERLLGVTFTDAQREMMLPLLEDRLENYSGLREAPVPNALAPAFQFDPRVGGASIPVGVDDMRLPSLYDTAALPASRPPDADLAFASIVKLGRLLRAGKVTSVVLTELSLSRLDTIGRRLEAVVTLTPERAREAARRADAELAAGIDRGPLHGIPYGAKDLLSVAGYPTTWGAMPYREQTIESDAAVIRKLDAAGAILVAKLTLGALANGDVWFGGMTRNPWNPDEGSSGSSAGPGAAVAAGLVPFAIGSETLGSIVSPSNRNGITGFRPTFGLVSRAGAMTLSWSMDKLGPMARSALDCAIVFDTINGRDVDDAASVSAPFAFDHASDVRKLRVGYLAEAFEAEYDERASDARTLDVVRSLGVELTPVSFPTDLPVASMLITLYAEASAAFDDLTRSGGVDSMVRQTANAWPNIFRAARFIPAVEFLQANRLRVELCRRMHAVMRDYDVVVSPSFRGGTLRITNLTGHPTVCIPNDFRSVEGNEEYRSPRSISLVGRLYGDAAPLRLAAAIQEKTDWHARRPPVG